MKKFVSLFLATLLMVSCMTPTAYAGIFRRNNDLEFPYHGLQADFYLVDDRASGHPFADYVSSYVDPFINFADMDPILAAKAGRDDWAGVIWTGRLVPPETADYVFNAYSDNGIRVYIDGERLINYWDKDRWDQEQNSRSLRLEAGKAYDIKVEYFDATGGAHVFLRWTKNGDPSTKEIIPRTAFYLPVDYQGPVVTDVDLSSAQLSLTQGLGGTIAVNGVNLDNGRFYLGRADGLPLEELQVQNATAERAELAVPATFEAGTYTVIAQRNNIQYYTLDYADAYFQFLYDEIETQRPEHPRPDWKRDQWINLNGYWKFEFDAAEEGMDAKWYEGREYSHLINVPFPWESSYSLIQNTAHRGNVWYEKDFVLDSSWQNKEVFLKFGAVDAISAVYVNGKLVAEHNGGYTPFECDISEQLVQGTNRITVWVDDKASYGDSSYPALVGKQGHNAPCGYTHTSGIWQTAYLEARSKTYLDYAHANPNIADAQVKFDLKVTSEEAKTVDIRYSFQSVLWHDDEEFNEPTGSLISGVQSGIQLTEGENFLNDLAPLDILGEQKLWNWNSPNLYEGTIEILQNGVVLDKVETYFGQREITTDKYDGRNYEYVYVNGEPTFMSGLLDQGFWEEGIYTAPSEEALKYDVKHMKDYGFNMLRKHLKVEDPLQYYWADRLGMFIWQDMPHATDMNRGDSSSMMTKGRPIYENALYAMLERDYNHPSVIAVMLFNETWGINLGSGASAADNMTTIQWMGDLYNKVKAYNPYLLVEDNSACWNDHIQPTDLNTYHFYVNGYQASKNTVNGRHNNTYPGSGDNFYGNYTQQGEPWFNSEYGGVGAGDKDWDVSWCFKYQTDIQRQYEKLNGYVYTEPFDIEYERNGILSYDRRDKIFAYEEIAYGGDMEFAHLNQPEYVGIDINPALELAPGSIYSAPAVALNWSSKDYTGEGLKMKWRFDATDAYGNFVSTGIRGEFDINYKPYTKETAEISFTLPEIKCVGTITVWIEDAEGELIAKNFVNLIADNGVTPRIEVLEDDTYVLRANVTGSEGHDEVETAGSIEYTYVIPSEIDAAALRNMRVLVEASSMKNETVNYGIENSRNSQTTIGAERPSDMTVKINGHVVDTVYLPDNPRDIRGTLTLTSAGSKRGSSAWNYGYLVNLNVSDELLATLQQEIAEDGLFTVTYSVETDAENQNGLRIYKQDRGRYLVAPTVILNSADTKVQGGADVSGNYAVEADLADGDSLSLRGDGYTLTLNGGALTLYAGDEKLGEAAVNSGTTAVRVRLFDDHIQVYANNEPVPVIDVYEFSGFTGGVTASSESMNLIVSPESYGAGIEYEVPESKGVVQYADSFTTQINATTGAITGSTFANRYKLYAHSGGSWDGNNADSNLKVNANLGNIAAVETIQAGDVIVEVDVTLLEEKAHNDGNMGFVLRGTNYIGGNMDGAHGYYVGVGNGYIRVGRMTHNWTELAKVDAPITWNETHRLKAVAVGNRIRVYLDDEPEPYVDLYDSTYNSGSVALRAFQVTGIFDNFVVSTAPRYDTDFEKGSISEWAVQSGEWKVEDGALSGSGMALVGDYGWTDFEATTTVELDESSFGGLMIRGALDLGKITGYKVGLDAENGAVKVIRVLQGRETVLDEAAAGIGAGEYELTVRIVNNTLRVYLEGDSDPILTVVDNDIINGAAGVFSDGTATFSSFAVKDKFIYEEDFNDGTLSGWNVVSGTMSVADNTLTINRVANGDKLTDGYATWGDYTLQADIQLEYNPQSKSNGGFVFRANDFSPGQDNLRGYVVGVNYNSGTAVPGEHTGIEMGDIHYGWRLIANTAQGEFTYEPSKWYNLEICTEGDTVTVLVDGEEYYSVEDYAYSYGQFGLRVFNSGMKVRNLKVIPAGAEVPQKDIRKALGELIEKAEALEEKDYTAETWQPLAEALTAAKETYDNEEATQEELQKAYDDLKTAVDALVKISGYEALQELIAKAEALEEDKYTEESWKPVTEALAKAKEITEESGEEAIKAAYDELKAALDALEEKEPAEVDKDALKALIAKAEDLDPDEYTEESYDAMLDTLEEAKAVADDDNATQEDVDEAAEALQEAIDALVPVDAEEIPVISIDLNAGSLNMLSIGNTLELNPTILPENATDKTVTYTSNNPNVASVDEDGVVTAHKTGTALITATASNGKVSKTTVRVTY